MKSSVANREHDDSEILKLIHELEVHQIELEMQNDELVIAKDRAEKAACDYTELYNFAPSGYFTLTRDGEILELNLTGSKMLGKERSLLINSMFVHYVSETSKPIFRLFLKNILEGNVKETCEIELAWGETGPAHLLLAAVVAGSGEQCLLSATDIANRKQAEMQLLQQKDEIEAQANEYVKLNEVLRKANADLEVAVERAKESDRLKSAFLANMSHEVRTPLNAIVGFANLIAQREIDPESLRKIAGIIDFNSKVLVKLIDEIIDLSKIEAGIIEINIEPVDVDLLLSNLLSIYELKKKELGRDNIVLRYYCSPEADVVMADSTRLVQILHNLTSNALKYTTSGYVEFGCSRIDEGMLKFYVEDTGIGISAKDAARVFTRFYKAKNEFTIFRGMGLGLSISKQLVEKMGGKIWMESVVDKGSTFYFTIPAKPHEITSQNLPDEKFHSDLKGKNVLVAEDDEGNFILSKMQLEIAGAKVIRAVNGKNAVDICAENNTIDFVLMDIKMPVMGGLEATRIIRKFRGEILIVAFSAFALGEMEQAAIQAGCNLCVSKPLDMKLLDSIVASHFNK
ncbi:MAG: response regulator [Bacteroidetes bacterium]|nr:response regulator [Bacteroidota bacterium]